MTNIDIIQALDNIRINNLYVHNSELEGAKFSNEKLKDRKVYLVETLAVINALVERGTMMLYGGHGGGTVGRPGGAVALARRCLPVPIK